MEEKIQKLLLPWEEYNKARPRAPYIFTRQRNNQFLIYFGAKHINDPQHEQYTELLDRWNEFINLTAGTRVAIGEGRNPRPVMSTVEEAITLYGEQGYLQYLANQEQVEVRYPDPSETSIWKDLHPKYSKDELFFHNIMQFAHQWNRGNKDSSFENYIERALITYRRDSNWKGYNFSLKHIQEISPDLIGKEFDEHASSLFYDLTNPSRFDTRFNAISRDIDVYRDTAVVGEIISQWRSGKSIFAVFGFSHVVIQERAIKEMTV